MFRGPYPVFGTEGQGTALRVYDPARPLSLMMAFLPSGFAACRYVSPSGGSIMEGTFECDYAPGYVLPPSGSITSNPIFISFGFPPAMAQMQYDYLLFNACAPAVSGKLPRAWVTVPDTEGLAVLRAEAANAVSAGITHALIPGNWEGRPGTLEGGAPKYPKNIEEAANALQSAGCSSGITVDPLLAHKGGGAWTAKSEDGQHWVNLNTAEGKKYTVSRLKKLSTKALPSLLSKIPPYRMRCWNSSLTRAQADAYAFAAANEAALSSKAIVLPASAAKINPVRDAFLDAASAMVQVRERNIGTSAITLRMGAQLPWRMKRCRPCRCGAVLWNLSGRRLVQRKTISPAFSQPPLYARLRTPPERLPWYGCACRIPQPGAAPETPCLAFRVPRMKPHPWKIPTTPRLRPHCYGSL